MLVKRQLNAKYRWTGCPVPCHPLGYLPLIPAGSLGSAQSREPNLYRGVRNVKYSAQFHFQQTYNFPACPSAHFLSSLMFKVCKDFPDFHINTRCEQGNVVTHVSPAGPSETWLSSLREEVCDLWDDSGPGGKSARGECDADIFAKCHECHDSWLGHFHTKSSLYTVYTKLNTALAQLITSPNHDPSLEPKFLFHEMVTSKESWMCQSFSPVPSLGCLQPTQVSAFEDVHNKPILKAGGTFVSRWALFSPTMSWATCYREMLDTWTESWLLTAVSGSSSWRDVRVLLRAMGWLHVIKSGLSPFYGG